jgi:Rhamnan synthesis protein F
VSLDQNSLSRTGGAPLVAAASLMTDICLFAHYDRADRLADHVLYYLKALQRAGFRVTVISTARLNVEDRDKLAAINADLVLRENTGLDFGSWAAGLARLRDASGRLNLEGRLLLANDSVFGPIGDLSDALRRLSALPGDVHCMVESDEIAPHMQSWFLLFSSNAYRDPSFEATFSQDFAAMPKSDIIRNGELSLSANLRNAGLRLVALAGNPPRGGTRRLINANPTHFLWRSLVERDGVPFIKVELLRDNPANILSIAGLPSLVRERAPGLLPMIDVFLGSQPNRAHTGRPMRWPAISSEAFVARDDRFAREGKRVAGYANRVVWRTLLIGLFFRKHLRALFKS